MSIFQNIIGAALAFAAIYINLYCINDIHPWVLSQSASPDISKGAEIRMNIYNGVLLVGVYALFYNMVIIYYKIVYGRLPD